MWKFVEAVEDVVRRIGREIRDIKKRLDIIEATLNERQT